MNEIKYDRQSRILDWDQSKLTDATVAVVGAGALGNHVCMGLIGLGIGTIKIYDYDTIEAHNLNRQSMFCEADIGKSKAEILASRLQERNSGIFILGINQKIEDEIVDAVLGQVDLLIDCVDRISVRQILNRYCLLENIPLVHGGISWMGGQIGILTRKTPCVNCFYPESMQVAEMDSVTSCIDKPESSVVYISQMVAGFMVSMTRRLLMPLPFDPSLPVGLYKFDFRFHPPLYFEPTNRKENCECVSILQTVAPDILEKEKIMQSTQNHSSKLELLQFLDNNIQGD